MIFKGRFEKGNIPWNKKQVKKNCLFCRRQIEISQSRHKEGRGKFCSLNCRRNYKYKLAKGFILTEDLAELIGAIIGDGCINKNYRRKDYRIQISGNKNEDKEYYDKYLPHLVFRCLGILPRPYLATNGAYILQFQSEPFRIFLNSLGIEPRKTKTVRIPFEIRKNIFFLQACIRGIADSDFTFICTKRKKDKPNNYPRICAQFASKPLVKDLEWALRGMGFTLNTKYEYFREDKRGFSYITNFINLDGPYNLRRWLNLIGFSNQRIITRYQVWMKTGILKPKTTIEERKRILMG
ncbi:hypothetical protein HOD38_04050 [archaeon]|jgi:hypothetical protein|nr:hypothetical protein [archaeon]MBT4397414.1 hypothetical protein [archaeon]MBT4440486.1 hypothetical protein [archaeon]